MRRTLHPVPLLPRPPFVPLAPNLLEPSYFLSLPGDLQRLIAEKYLSVDDIESLRRTNTRTLQYIRPIYLRKLKERLSTPLMIPKQVITSYFQRIPPRFAEFVTNTLFEVTESGNNLKVSTTFYQIALGPAGFQYITTEEIDYMTRQEFTVRHEIALKISNYDLLTQYSIYRTIEPYLARYRVLIELTKTYNLLSRSDDILFVARLNRFLLVNSYIFDLVSKPKPNYRTLEIAGLMERLRGENERLYSRLREKLISLP